MVPANAVTDLTNSVVDLGSWVSLNPYGTTGKRTVVLANHRDRIYIGHVDGVNAKANAPVFYDTNIAAYGTAIQRWLTYSYFEFKGKSFGSE